MCVKANINFKVQTLSCLWTSFFPTLSIYSNQRIRTPRRIRNSSEEGRESTEASKPLTIKR